MMDVGQKILEILENNLEQTDNPIALTLDLRLEELGINSIGFIKMVTIIESEFGIEFDDDDLDISRFETFHSIVKYTEDKVQNR